jgi:hypothetical protein
MRADNPLQQEAIQHMEKIMHTISNSIFHLENNTIMAHSPSLKLEALTYYVEGKVVYKVYQ